MEGYDVVTVDDDKVGKVVGTQGAFLVVESGTLFKSKHAVPRDLSAVDEDEHVVRVTVAKEIIDDSPKVGDSLDEQAVAAYYGLGEGFAAPETEGYGTLESGETAVGAEVQGTSHGVDSPVQERAEARASLRPDGETPGGEDLPGAQIRPTSGTQ